MELAWVWQLLDSIWQVLLSVFAAAEEVVAMACHQLDALILGLRKAFPGIVSYYGVFVTTATFLTIFFIFGWARRGRPLEHWAVLCTTLAADISAVAIHAGLALVGAAVLLGGPLPPPDRLSVCWILYPVVSSVTCFVASERLGRDLQVFPGPVGGDALAAVLLVLLAMYSLCTSYGLVHHYVPGT